MADAADTPTPKKLTLENAAALVCGDTGFPPGLYRDPNLRLLIDETFIYASVLLLSQEMVDALQTADPAWLTPSTTRQVRRLDDTGPNSEITKLRYLRLAVCLILGLDEATVDNDTITRTLRTMQPPRIAAEEKPAEELVRVLRVVEYTGPRALVEEQVKRSIHGTRQGQTRTWDRKQFETPCLITAVTLSEYPERLEAARTLEDRKPPMPGNVRPLDSPPPPVAQSAPSTDAPPEPAAAGASDVPDETAF